jgi:hypothetical protein
VYEGGGGGVVTVQIRERRKKGRLLLLIIKELWRPDLRSEDGKNPPNMFSCTVEFLGDLVCTTASYRPIFRLHSQPCLLQSFYSGSSQKMALYAGVGMLQMHQR